MTAAKTGRKARSETERIEPHRVAPKGTETPESFIHRGEIFVSDGSGGFTDIGGRAKTLPKDAKRERFGLDAESKKEGRALAGNPEHRIEQGAKTSEISEIRRARMERDAASGHSFTKPGASGSGVALEDADDQETASAVDGAGNPASTDAFNRRSPHSRAGEPGPLRTTGSTGRRERSSPSERRAAEKTATKTASKTAARGKPGPKAKTDSASE